MKSLIAGALAGLIIALVVAGISFQYGECKMVGHSTLYCILFL